MNTPDEPRAEVPLHAMNPTSRFANRVADYVRARPSYPPEAVDRVLTGVDLARAVVADVGAGTGLFTRLLDAALGRAARLLALEPNAEMLSAGRDATGPRVEWRPAPAEATGLPNQSCDLIVCAQAFHWFEPHAALAEFQRVLKPAGRVALVWNDRDLVDPFTAEFSRLVREASAHHPAERRFDQHAALEHSPRFRGFSAWRTTYHQPLDAEGVLSRARSASYCPMDGPTWARLRDDLLTLHKHHADSHGRVRLVYITSVYTATAEPSAT